jgi:hypothetical protein
MLRNDIPENKSYGEDSPTNQMIVAIADSPLIEPRNRALALIDEGNRLEEQGRIPEVMALYDG